LKTHYAFLIGLTLFVMSPLSVAAQASAHVDVPATKVEFDNEQVQVFRMRIGPHATTPMHAVTPRVIVWLTDANLQMKAPDGTISVEHHVAGESGWVPSGTHAGTNLGDQAIEFVAVVPKAAHH
jgi:hypothetical protein